MLSPKLSYSFLTTVLKGNCYFSFTHEETEAQRNENDLPTIILQRWQKGDRNPALLAPGVHSSEFFPQEMFLRAGRGGDGGLISSSKNMQTA